jgi:hypothetical protein
LLHGYSGYSLPRVGYGCRARSIPSILNAGYLSPVNPCPLPNPSAARCEPPMGMGIWVERAGHPRCILSSMAQGIFCLSVSKSPAISAPACRCTAAYERHWIVQKQFNVSINCRQASLEGYRGAYAKAGGRSGPMMLAHTTGGGRERRWCCGMDYEGYKYRLQHYRQATVLSDHCV